MWNAPTAAHLLRRMRGFLAIRGARRGRMADRDDKLRLLMDPKRDPSAAPTETRITGPADVDALAELTLPTLTVLAHPDPDRVGERAILPGLTAAGRREAVRLSRLEPEFAAPRSTVASGLGDAHLSRRPILLGALKEGAIEIVRDDCRTPIEIDGETLAEHRTLALEELRGGVVLTLGHRVVLLLHLDTPILPETPDHGLIGLSPPMLRLHREISLVAGLGVPVLIRGESGTGKELVARAIHRAGPRREAPYLTVNMAAIPESLAASELFGAAKGAFTGADRRKEGFFERADGGTLFLDEIGDTPAALQPLLLRALESGEIQSVGSAATRRVDVRVVAATDADLESRLRDGSFRRPLLHRLAGYDLRVAPLRERRADFGRLLYHFLRLEIDELSATCSAQAREALAPAKRPWPAADLVARLATLSWPGNVRQLRNAARRLVIARLGGATARVEELVGESDGISGPLAIPPQAARSPATRSPATDAPPLEVRPVYRKPAEVSEDELLATLRQNHFELKPTAAALGVSRGTLYNLVESCPRVRKANDLERAEIEQALGRADGDHTAAAFALEVSPQGLKRRMTTLGIETS